MAWAVAAREAAVRAEGARVVAATGVVGKEEVAAAGAVGRLGVVVAMAVPAATGCWLRSSRSNRSRESH